ncbi:MAG TPA: glycosyltransferase family 2 protein [Gammaproteobacteria bacterium]|nr:glycosyltransferase family 2 protein [Gammaproteobacteria bacterium]
MRITGVIITLNEAEFIEACIHSLQRVCDEIIVVDSLSQDETVALAEAAGARVIKQAYLGDGPQKAHGVPFAKNDWILAIDADERLDDDAVDLIQSLALDDPGRAYAFRRKNYVGSRWVRAAGLYPDPVVRLYNRTQAGYVSKQAHAFVEAPRKTITKAHISHYRYRDLSHWIQRMNELSSRDAWAMKNRGKKPSVLNPPLHALWALFRMLVLKGGLIQGTDGIMVAATTTLHCYMKYAKLNERYEKEAATPEA